MRIIFLFIAISLSTLVSSHEKEQWQGFVSVEQSIPSYLSIDDARLYGIKRLQLLAATNSGAMVIRTEILSNDTYQDIIKVVAAAFVKLENVKERVIQNDDSAASLHLSANATVDLTSLSERIDYIKENEQLRLALSDLSERYLTSINNPIAKISYPLFFEHDALVTRWLSKEEFIGLSKHHQSALLRAKTHLIRNVYEPLFNNSTLTANIDSIIDNGDDYTISINVNFDFDDRKINEALSVYWDTRNRSTANHPYILIDGTKIKNDVLSSQSINALFDLMKDDLVAIEVSIGNSSKRIPVAYVGNDFRPGCNVTAPRTGSSTYCISKITNNVNNPLNTSYFRNPVSLSVSAKDIQNMNGEEVRVRLVKMRVDEIDRFSLYQVVMER